MTEHQDTESKIFEAARTVFAKNGYSGTRMQEIASEANINQSMLHYYFRTKDQLFEKVYQKAMEAFFPQVINILEAPNPLDKKIHHLVEAYFTKWENNCYLFSFVLMEMNRHPDRVRNFVKDKFFIPESFSNQIKSEIEQGHITAIEPHQLLINTISLILFPFMSQLMIESMYKMSHQEFENLIEERRSLVPEFILHAIKYQAHD